MQLLTCAFSSTIMVHSEEDYNAAVEASGILFGNATSEALKKLDEDTLLSVFEGVPQFEVAKTDIEAGIKAVDLFAEKTNIFPSKGEMRKMVQGGGVSMNKEKLTAFDQTITCDDLLDGKYLQLLSDYCKINTHNNYTLKTVGQSVSAVFIFNLYSLFISITS